VNTSGTLNRKLPPLIMPPHTVHMTDLMLLFTSGAEVAFSTAEAAQSLVMADAQGGGGLHEQQQKCALGKTHGGKQQQINTHMQVANAHHCDKIEHKGGR